MRNFSLNITDPDSEQLLKLAGKIIQSLPAIRESKILTIGEHDELFAGLHNFGDCFICELMVRSAGIPKEGISVHFNDELEQCVPERLKGCVPFCSFKEDFLAKIILNK